MEDGHEITSALHDRRKNRSPMRRISCCFNAEHRRAGSLFDLSSILPSPNRRSPSSWMRSKNFMPRTGKHRRHSSADFSYDPLSYALNFEDSINDVDPSEGDDPTRNFSSRLPATPPRATIVASSPSPGKTLSVSRGTSDQLSSRAAGVGELMKKLELSPAEMRMNVELTTRRRPTDQVSRSAESLEVPTAEDSRTIEKSTARAAAVAEVRRSLEFEDVTPSRQVLVELC